MTDIYFPDLNFSLSPVDFDALMDDSRPDPEPIAVWSSYKMALKGEIVRVAGEGGVGKSFLMLELTAIGIAADIHLNANKVLWIDEEGDEEILRERLKMLGVKEADLKNRFAYFLNQDIHLDQPQVREALFSFVKEWEPEVIVIDSSSRIYASLSENSGDDMALLYNKGIKPLSRKYGATVFVIDHLNKGGEGGSINNRVRGSSDKVNQVDRVWMVKNIEGDSFELAHGKCRRGAAPPPMTITRVLEQGQLTHRRDIFRRPTY